MTIQKTDAELNAFLAGEPVEYNGMASHSHRRFRATFLRNVPGLPFSVLQVHELLNGQKTAQACSEQRASAFFLNLHREAE
jgi:hypothetical protein